LAASSWVREVRPRKGGGSLGPISAVVCNFNGEHYLEECLRSLLESDPGVDEIIVVDNASTDRSVEVIRQHFPQVKLLRLPKNGGPCVARNAGVRAARNRFVLAVDNDAVLLKDTLGKLQEALSNRPDAVAVQPRSVYANEPDRVHYNGGRFHYVGLYSLRNFGVPLAEAQGEGVLDVDGLIAICILFDSDAFLQVGGYDENLFILFEDFDLSMRLRIAGYKLLAVESAIVKHKGGTPGISFRGDEYPKFRAYYHSRNRWLVLYKNYSIRTLIAGLPGAILYELAWAVFTIKEGHFLVHLAGKKAFFQALKCTRIERKKIQSTRRTCDKEILVGGPLTFSPQLVERPSAKLAADLLDGALRLFWAGAKHFAG
jgi:GT2 family glycosyltransferase